MSREYRCHVKLGPMKLGHQSGPSLVNNRNYMLELTPLTQKTCLYVVNHQKAKNYPGPGRNCIINDFRIISTFPHK